MNRKKTEFVYVIHVYMPYMCVIIIDGKSSSAPAQSHDRTTAPGMDHAWSHFSNTSRLRHAKLIFMLYSSG